MKKKNPYENHIVFSFEQKTSFVRVTVNCFYWLPVPGYDFQNFFKVATQYLHDHSSTSIHDTGICKMTYTHTKICLRAWLPRRAHHEASFNDTYLYRRIQILIHNAVRHDSGDQFGSVNKKWVENSHATVPLQCAQHKNQAQTLASATSLQVTSSGHGKRN